VEVDEVLEVLRFRRRRRTVAVGPSRNSDMGCAVEVGRLVNRPGGLKGAHAFHVLNFGGGNKNSEQQTSRIFSLRAPLATHAPTLPTKHQRATSFGSGV
jgi:hypothetical protein